MTSQLNESLIRIIAGDRVKAHQVFFSHRHGKITPPAHAEVIADFHSPHPKVVVEAFRGFGKSTIGEETVILGGALQELRNGLIIGASYERACERLESIKHEYDTNEDLEQAFGRLRGDATWTESKIVLSNGVVIQAKGAGQSLRGVKHHDARPDFVLIDDLEDEESVRTPTARQEMLRWLYKTLMPALAEGARIRFIGNRLDPEAVIVKISKDPAWKHLRFPVMYADEKTGEDKATWPDLFPLERVYAIRAELQRQGLFEDFNQEYLCEADTPETKIFRPEHFASSNPAWSIVQPRIRTWEACWAMVDPARSVGKRSASTAIPIWSWIGNRLVVWDCLIGHWLPDEIIAKMLEVDATYRPAIMGVEEDALNEFILQPLRQAQVKYGQPLPLRPMAAKKYTEGRGKDALISSLQPFFAAHEVVFAKPLPELQAQFLSFPKGLKDGPNALAYALKLRPGAPIYDEFGQQNIVEDLGVAPARPLFLAMNATRAFVTAVLLQYDGSSLNIIADDVVEGDPGQAAAALVRRMNLACMGRPMRLTAPPGHFEQWSNVGLRAALARVPIELGRGGDPAQGQGEIRALFQRRSYGLPAVQVAHAARWTLNAFAGGYCRPLGKGGVLAQGAEEGIYKELMLGLESFAALVRVEDSARDRDDGSLRRTADGRLYRSAMASRRD